MSKYKVYITDVRHESYEIERRILAEIGAERIPCNCSSPEEIIRTCADADGLLLDLAPCNAEFINGL